LKGLPNRLARVVKLLGNAANGPPFAEVETSDKLNIDHLEHLLSSLTSEFFPEVRVMDEVLGVVPFFVITPLSVVPF